MRHPCFIVVAITRDKVTKEMSRFDIYNCFETEAQARACLQYEADLCKAEWGEEATWIDPDALLLPDGWNPAEETLVLIDESVDFFDKREPLFRYEEE